MSEEHGTERGGADMAGRDRLDRVLVARGLVTTRSRARDLILRGEVRVGGTIVDRPAVVVGADQSITVGAAARHVSRAAVKLAAGLDAFAVSPAGAVCLDIGASTGGFTQTLLERGARHVVAVDVGRDQLDASLRADPRVTSLEGRDARSLTIADLPELPGLVVADVSFVSLTLALPVPLSLAAPDSRLVALVKPQFEAGRAAIGKGGIVRDPADEERAVDEVRAWLDAQPGWRVLGVVASPISGGDGNREHLIGAERHG